MDSSPADRLLRHKAEIVRRLRWCLDHGLYPAHDRVHEAPGDDSEFMHGIPPWHPDGRVNPAGVADNVTIEAPPSGFALMDDYCKESGWVCQKCSEWVPVPPRKCDAAREPEDWWWCLKCKQNKKAKSQKEKKIEAVAATCKSVRDMFKSKPK